MSASVRVRTVVAALAVLAAVVTVGVTAIQSRGDEPAGPPGATLPKGAPPFALELGLRTDREARLLRRAASMLDRDRRAQARRLFASSSSLEARVGAALAVWPRGTVPALERLAVSHPRSALVRVNLGLALLWAGRERRAEATLRAALPLEPDSAYAIRADDALHLDTPRGLPPFLPAARFPAAFRRLPVAGQLRALARAARRGGVTERILYGVALQRAGRPVSAERQFALAARAAPADPEALTAAAVGRFRKSAPTPAFARLGPLTRRFPRAPVVRLHLGLLLFWLGRIDEARPQLRRAAALAPRSVHGRQADRLARLLSRK